MWLVFIKRSILEIIRGSITKIKFTKRFFDIMEKLIDKTDKGETSSTLSNLFLMSYKGKENIKEYILEMSNLTSKVKAMKFELLEVLIMHLILICFLIHFEKLNICYNTPKDKRPFNELIHLTMCKRKRG